MFLPPEIVPPVAQFMSPRLKSPPKNILAFLYLLSLLIFESDFSNSCIAFSSESGGRLKDPISIWSLSFGLISTSYQVHHLK
jgi:hypothetical protein